MERTSKKLSFPKNKIKVLLLENIHTAAEEIFVSEGYQVMSFNGALSETELLAKIKDVSILGIRSRTILSDKVLDSAERLLAVGTFSIGTNQIDLKAASERGIAVFNAPYSNTRSVVELAIGGMIALFRRIAEFNSAAHSGRWVKTSSGSHELRGKTLGIVGYGNIGSQLSILAEILGLKVIFYDMSDRLALGNAVAVNSLGELLERSDIVSVHVDGRNSNSAMFSHDEFGKMKKGSLFMNLSRGFIVDEEALAKFVKSGHIAGAFLDVYQKEPKSSSEPFKNKLTPFPNVILTPHIGGATEEAQENIGEFVSNKIIQFINIGSTDLSVNLPNLALPRQENVHRLIHIHKNLPGALSKINLLFAEKGANITGQYLGTMENTGYVITDVDSSYDKELLSKLRGFPETIRTRVLY